MKHFTYMLFLLIGFSAMAQTTFKEKLGSFNEVKVFDGISVTLIKSENNSAEAKGDKAMDVKYILDDETLIVRLRTSERLDADNTKVDVYYTSIEVLDANEGSIIKSDELFQQPSLELRVQEGGLIYANLEVESLKIKAVTGGYIEASGKATKQEVKLNTGGNYDGKELKTETSRVRVTAAGRAKVYATKKIDAKVTAGGNIKIYGNPEIKDTSKFAGGTIEFIE